MFRLRFSVRGLKCRAKPQAIQLDYLHFANAVLPFQFRRCKENHLNRGRALHISRLLHLLVQGFRVPIAIASFRLRPAEN